MASVSAVATDEERPLPPSRWRRLKAATAGAHGGVDREIMARRPFESRARYRCFLHMQYQFFRDVDPLYEDAALRRLFPDLPARRRLGHVARDLDDLGVEVPASATLPSPLAGLPRGANIGWLYVAEGSRLGAVFLLRAAHGLGLSDGFGARHLGTDPTVRGGHWGRFTRALDAAEIPVEQDVIDGAHAAFRRVHALIGEAFGPAGP